MWNREREQREKQRELAERDHNERNEREKESSSSSSSIAAANNRQNGHRAGTSIVDADVLERVKQRKEEEERRITERKQAAAKKLQELEQKISKKKELGGVGSGDPSSLSGDVHSTTMNNAVRALISNCLFSKLSLAGNSRPIDRSSESVFSDSQINRRVDNGGIPVKY